jgi:hypothetical protein
LAIIIRLIQTEDIDKGFLQALENLLPADIDQEHANQILQNIKSNPLHKIFVAKDDMNDKIAGTTTLLIEPKFIDKGMRVGYIEDVSVRNMNPTIYCRFSESIHCLLEFLWMYIERHNLLAVNYDLNQIALSNEFGYTYIHQLVIDRNLCRMHTSPG